MAPLLGLVLAGGKSARMGNDKALIAYHGRPQAEFLFDLLRPRCEAVHLSCRPDQAQLPGYVGLPCLVDAYADLGPLAGILTALEARPDAAWLVAACDLPYLDADAVAALVAGRDPAALATAFEGPLMAGAKTGSHGKPEEISPSGPRRPRAALPDLSFGPGGRLPEPLFAIYEPAMLPRIRELLPLGIDCPRKAITKSRCRILPAPDPRFLANVNSPEERDRAFGDLGGRAYPGDRPSLRP